MFHWQKAVAFGEGDDVGLPVTVEVADKRDQAGFRKIFAAPNGQLVMALDYGQIELRAVAELISDWFGTDSILRQSFVAGLDAHTATAMSMTGKTNPQDVTDDERQLAKPCNFGLLYRMRYAGFQLPARQLCPGHHL